MIPNFQTQKGISKKLQPLRKGPYQITAKPTEVTYKLIDTTKKEIVQHRNNLLPYYPKEYALRELTQLCSFTGLKVIQNNTRIDPEKNETNENQRTQFQKQDKSHKDAKTLNSDTPTLTPQQSTPNITSENLGSTPTSAQIPENLFNPPNSNERLPYWTTQSYPQAEPNLVNDPINDPIVHQIQHHHPYRKPYHFPRHHQ